MKRVLLILFCFLPLFLFAAASEEELSLRRIQTLWQEKDYPLAKKAIEDFLERFPENSCASKLTLLLCDMALKEQNFTLACDLFTKLPKEKLSPDVRKRLWRILLHLNDYEALLTETKELIDTDLEARFCYATASFRLSLADETKKKAQLQEALSLFSSLKEESGYALESRAAIVSILKELKRESEAEEELVLLADLIKEKKEINEEILLFTATQLQKQNPAKAKELLILLLDKGEKRKKEGASLLFSLLTKTKEIEPLITHEKQFTSLLDNKHLALYYFIVGRSFSEKKLPSEALGALEKSLDLALPSPYDKEALSRLAAAAFQTTSILSLERAYHEFLKRYPNEAMEISKIELALASLYSEKGREKEALSLLDKMSKKGVLLEEATLEKVKLLAKMKAWQEGNELAEEYLTLHPKSLPMHEARISLLSSWSEVDLTPAVQEKIAAALEMANEVDEIFDREDQEELHLSYGRALLNSGKTARAILHLESLLKEKESNPEIYLLLALANLKEKRLDKFISYGERALVCQVDESQELHLPLFDAYHTLAKEERDCSLDEKAASHLLNAIHLEKPITLDQRLWLFHHMATRAKESGDRREIDQTISLMERFIQDKGSEEKFKNEAIELIYLFAAKGDFIKAAAWIERLSKEGDKSDELMLAKADILHLQKKNSEAHDLYERLKASENSEVSFSATLKATRLAYAALPEEKKKKETPEVKELLATLKELTLHKSARTEPLHIEAAIDSVDMTARTFSKNEKDKKLLLLLRETKAQFLSEEDLPSKDYHAELKELPEKRALVDCYLRYIDSWIYTVEGSLAKRKEEREAKEKMASLLLTSLKTETPRSLKERAALLEERLR